MKITRAEKLIAAYLSGNSAVREEEELMAWVDDNPESQKFFDKTVALWNIADQGDSPDFSKGKNQAWDQLDTTLFANEQQAVSTAKIRKLYFSKMFAIAASIALLLVAGWWWQSSQTFNIQTFASERIMIELPDGTQVWLNENSQLSYENLGSERRLTFEGEAYFDVQTDSLKPFKIYSGRAVTTVMGTAFNLRAYPKEDVVEVSVAEGKVALTQTTEEQVESNRIELTVGQTGVFEKEEAVVKKLEEEATPNKMAWKERKFRFESLKLAQILPSIERYFDVKIILENENLLDCTTFNANPNDPSLDDMINFLVFFFEFETETHGKTIRLIGGRCQ